MKEDNWFKKHPVWSGVVILLLFFLIIGIFSGDIKETGEGIKPIPLENNISSEPTENESFVCFDSDGGKDYHTKGYINLGNGEKWWDECYDKQNPDYLGEYYCNSQGLVDSENIKCPYGCNDGKCNAKPSDQNVFFLVTRVIDGDTIEIEGGERVRFICINTPETGEYIYLKAKNFVTDILLYKEVKLVKDVTDRDKYGRLLRYIYLEDGTFVNEQIVRVGYGVAYPYGRDTSLCPLIENAEREAKEDEIGIWAIEEEEEVLVSEEEYVCSTNVYNCGDFSSCSDVMEVFNGCGFDVHKLDGDNDGIPCESLCGG